MVVALARLPPRPAPLGMVRLMCGDPSCPFRSWHTLAEATAEATAMNDAQAEVRRRFG